MAQHPGVDRVNAIMAGNGFAGRVLVLSDAAPTARAAAELLGVGVGAIANSLIFRTDSGAPLLVMTSGAHRVDTDKVAALIGEGVGRADAAFVRTHTGQAIGGVAPVGHPVPIRTLIDTDLRGHDQLWTGGGIPHGMLPMSFDELVALTSGEVAAVA